VPSALDFTERLAARDAAPQHDWFAALQLKAEPDLEQARAQRLICGLAGELSSHIDAVAVALTERVLAGETRLADPHDPTVAALVAQFARSTAGSMLATLAYGSPTNAASPTRASLSLFERLAERDDGLAIALRAYRLLTAELWQIWAAFVDERLERSQYRPVLSISTAQIAECADSVAEQLAAAWAETRRRRRRGIAVPVEELVRRALYGSPTDAAAALEQLGYPLEGSHLAVALPAGVERDQLEHLSRRLRLACAASTLVAAEPETATIWLAVPRSALDTPVERTRPLLELDGPVGLGEPGSGIEGFRRTFQQAGDALRMAMLSDEDGVTRYRDVALLAVLCADEVRARELVRAVLGPLADGDEAAARVRDTVSAYLAAGESQVAAARLLFIHDKTVKYRLGQAEALLGYKIGDRRAELSAALMIHRAYEASQSPPEVLGGHS
jgi:GGDEF-like domain/PucR C-terminal helix-turn-helix domain